MTDDEILDKLPWHLRNKVLNHLDGNDRPPDPPSPVVQRTKGATPFWLKLSVVLFVVLPFCMVFAAIGLVALIIPPIGIAVLTLVGVAFAKSVTWLQGPMLVLDVPTWPSDSVADFEGD